MENEILEIIRKTFNDSSLYYFDFDERENITSDTVTREMEGSKFMFELTIKIWVKNSISFGFQSQEIEVISFMVWDEDSKGIDVDISNEDIAEQITLYL